MRNERELVAYPGLEVERCANRLFFGTDEPPPDGEHGESTMFSVVVVLGGFRGRFDPAAPDEIRPGVAMSVRTNDEHADVIRALIDTLRSVADKLESEIGPGTVSADRWEKERKDG